MDARQHPMTSSCNSILARPEDVAEREEFFRLGLAGRHSEVKTRMNAAIATMLARIDARRLVRSSK